MIMIHYLFLLNVSVKYFTYLQILKHNVILERNMNDSYVSVHCGWQEDARDYSSQHKQGTATRFEKTLHKINNIIVLKCDTLVYTSLFRCQTLIIFLVIALQLSHFNGALVE